MNAVFLLSIAACAAFRLRADALDATAAAFTLEALFIALYVLWLLGEARISRRDMNRENREMPDGGSCLLYGGAQFLVFLSALLMPPARPGLLAAQMAGLALFALGVALRLWAIRSLAGLYSHRVCLAKEHAVVSCGPYCWLRHPAYAGMLLAHCGVLLCFFNWLTAGLLFAALVPAVIYRIRLEERLLFQLPGYARFAARRRRLCPFVW